MRYGDDCKSLYINNNHSKNEPITAGTMPPCPNNPTT